MALPHRQPGSVSWVVRHVVLVSLLAVFLLPGAAWAQGERLSIIVSGSQTRVDALAARHGAQVTKRLTRGAVLEISADRLDALTAEGDDIDPNQTLRANMAVTLATTGADQVQAGLPAYGIGALTGKGVGVAVVDSGVAKVPELRHVVARVDFVDPRGRGLDLNGHGTHVSGIIAAARSGAAGGTRGMAPDAHIVSLRVLDANGEGTAADVIAAIDWLIENGRKYRVRVVNLSLGGAPLLSWHDDPMCEAIERAHDAGMVTFVSAGNFGKDAEGRKVSGGVTTPGHCPHAITVGAVNAKGTLFRSDDAIATYSSRGPTYRDRLLKPDLAAPGNRILGLLAPDSTLAREHPEFIVDTPAGKRLELSGTSMATAAASGAAALLLEQRAHLAPMGVRVALQATATLVPSYGLVAQGAGSLNILAAVLGSEIESWSGTSVIGGEAVTSSRLAFRNDALNGDPIIERGTTLVPKDHFADPVDADDILIWGDDILIWGDDILIWGDDILIWGDDILIWGDDILIWGDDILIWGDDILIWGDDILIWGD